MQTAKELPACPVETTLMLIGDKWKVLILRDLMTVIIPGLRPTLVAVQPSQIALQLI